MRADAAKPCSAPSSPAWLRDGPVTTPEPNKSQPRLAVFSHIVELMDERNPQPDGNEIERRTRTNWAGNLVVGTDLARFVLTPGNVTVQHFDEVRGFHRG